MECLSKRNNRYFETNIKIQGESALCHPIIVLSEVCLQDTWQNTTFSSTLHSRCKADVATVIFYSIKKECQWMYKLLLGNNTRNIK